MCTTPLFVFLCRLNFLKNKTKELFPASQAGVWSAEVLWGLDRWWNTELLQELMLLSQSRVVQRQSLHLGNQPQTIDTSSPVHDFKELQSNLSEDVLHNTKM